MKSFWIILEEIATLMRKSATMGSGSADKLSSMWGLAKTNQTQSHTQGGYLVVLPLKIVAGSKYFFECQAIDIHHKTDKWKHEHKLQIKSRRFSDKSMRSAIWQKKLQVSRVQGWLLAKS